MTDDRYDLARFVGAQDTDDTYDHAVQELRDGLKSTHWMWFVFPQIAGLGRSETARHYAIIDIGEAQAYLRQPELAARLHECAEIMADPNTPDAETVLGTVDAAKLQSSMTLFRHVDPTSTVYQRVLDRHFNGQPDDATLALL